MKALLSLVAIAAAGALLLVGWPLLLGLAVIGFIGLMVLWGGALLLAPFIGEATPAEIRKTLDETAT